MRRRAFVWISAMVLICIAAGIFLALRISSAAVKSAALDDLKSSMGAARGRYFELMDAQQAASAFKVETGKRATLIEADGSVIADSDFEPFRMENHLNRPEVQKALETGDGWALRESDTAGAPNLYYAERMRDGSILRLSLPLISIMAAAKSETWLIFASSALMCAVGLFAAYRISDGIASKTERVAGLAQKYAGGDFSLRMPEEGSGTEAKLARSFNYMADELSSTIGGLGRQRAELTGILSSISDGVLFVDRDMSLTLMNEAAKRMLGADFLPLFGEHLLKSLRDHKLEQALAFAMSEGRHYEYEGSNSVTQLAVSANPVRVEGGATIGAVAVIRDLSGSKKLERMRSEFVANVTHELKTPLTSIRGFAESLTGEDDSAERDRFLGVIVSEADRMSKLVDDIIALSSIETVGVGEGPSDLGEEVRYAADIMAPLASSKGIGLKVEVEEGLRLDADSATIRRLALNLMDNAVKYTPEGGEVRVRAFRSGNIAVLEVADNGIGIAGEHLSRVFERFYRVDASRSRQLGGTGLGLSIVKHIALSMGGQASVKSEIGEGSIFTVSLPSSAPLKS